MMAVAQSLASPMPGADFLPLDGATPDLPGGFAALLAQLDLVSTATDPTTSGSPPAAATTASAATVPAKPAASVLMSSTAMVAASVADDLPATRLLASLPPEAKGEAAPPPPFSTLPNLVLPRYPGMPIDTPVEAAPEAVTSEDEDDGPVPKGLEKVADALATALAAVMAAASKTREARPDGKIRPDSPGRGPSIAVAHASPQANLPFKITQLPPPVAPDQLQAAAEPPTGVDIHPASPDRPASVTPSAATEPQDPALLSVASATPTASPSPTAASTSPVQTATPAEIVINHHLDLARDGEWLDQLARDIVRTASHDTQLRFQLNPEHLGSLHVEIANRSEGTAVRLTADTEAARSILSDAQPRLIAEARAQGLRISEAHVDLGGSSGHQNGQQQRHQASSEAALVRTQQGHQEPEAETPRSSAERYA